MKILRNSIKSNESKQTNILDHGEESGCQNYGTKTEVRLFCDVETTDRIKGDEIPDIIEIAFTDGKNFEYQSLVKPVKPITMSAYNIHNI